MNKKFRAKSSQIKAHSARKKRKYKLEQGLTSPLLKKLKEKVLEERPMLADILREGSGKSLYDLAVANCYPTKLVVPLERKQEFLEVFSEETNRLLGPIIAKKATAQLDKYYFVSTVDHQGPNGNPRYLTSNLLASMPFFEPHDSLLSCQIVLSCANVSFGNASLPRGLIYHMPSQTDILESVINFFERNVDSRPVVYFRPYTQESIEEIKRRLNVLMHAKTLPEREYIILVSLIDSLYASPDVYKLSTFSEQMTVTNAMLWKHYFGNKKNQAPELVLLEQEHMANLLILRHIQKNSLVNKFILDNTFHALIMKNFEGIQGAFSLKEKSGTFLFWALPPGQKYRQQLWKKDNTLITNDGSYKVELTTEAISQEIIDKHLIPSLATVYVTLCFYYGLRILGGFNQTTYLTEMKHAFSQTLNEYQGKQDADIPISTTDLAFSRAILAFLKHPTGITVPASGLDIIMYGNESTWPEMIAAAKQIPLEKALYRALPSLYSAYYPKEKQEPGLLAITEQDVEKFTGLDKLLYTIPIS